MILRLGTRCLIVRAPTARHVEGLECVIIASCTRGTSPTAWYKGRMNDGTIVTGPPRSFLSVEPVPIPKAIP